MSERLGAWIAALVIACVGAGLVYSLLSLPERAPGLADDVAARLAESGVENPVTAVLLNFRGYDTLLEIAVLSLAIIGIWSIRVMPRRRVGAPGLVMAYLVQVLVPFMVLLGAYLLWAGSHDAGGAFQAGAVFAAAMVLVLLGGAPLPGALSHWPLRVLLMLGLTTFLAVGVLMMVGDGRFLEYPVARAKNLILLVEATAAISIGAILATGLRGGRPPPEAER